MTAAMEIVISSEDVPYEEDVLREPFKLSGWVRYLSARRAAPPAKRAVIYERAVRALPGSYKLWHSYLTELTDAAGALPVTDRAHADLNAAFERALAAGMFRMPRIWHMYASSLLHQRQLTRARRALDRALRSLPTTQHHHVWPLLLRLASLPGCPAPTAHRILRRHLQFDPDTAEDFVAFLVSAGRWKDAADQLVAAINEGDSVSLKRRNKSQILLDLCDLLSQHPEEVAGMPVDAILGGSIRRFPEEAGVLWTSLASHYARMGIHDKARDVFEEGITTATTVKDFRMVFEAYVHFEHTILAAEVDERGQEESAGPDLVQDCWLADRDCTDMNMARLERLLERRPELLNSVRLRQNPHDVQAWHDRASIFVKDPAKQAATYVEAVNTVDPMKPTAGKPHTLWLALAKMYGKDGLVDSARAVFQRATKVNFKAVDDLATVYCEWAHMEVMHQNSERAVDLIRQATSEPPMDARRRRVVAGQEESVVMNDLHRSLKLWCLYLDLMKTQGSLDSICNAYERMHDLGIITPLLVLNHASTLEEHKRFGDAFRVYERGVNSFKHPHSDAIWEAYLTKFVQRHGSSRPERVRDMFESAILQAPPQRKKALCLEYAKYEENFGLTTRAMKIYEDAARVVPACDKLGVYELYIKRATQLCGLVKARDIYSRAIHAGGLLDKDARAMCVKFADLELGLGEVARARAIHLYTSSFTDPKAHPDFWKRWNDFEVLHGDESTFREMLRVKRTMTATASATAVVETGPKRPLYRCADQQLDHEGIGQQCKRTRLV